jgi:hypothetical protein
MTNLLSNKYVSGFVSVLIALYAVFIAPALPNKVLQFFDTPIGRLFFIFLAAYLASEGNTQVALMVSIALTISLMALEKKTLEESFLQRNNHLENFQNTNDTLGLLESTIEPVGVESESDSLEGSPIDEEMEEGILDDEQGVYDSDNESHEHHKHHDIDDDLGPDDISGEEESENIPSDGGANLLTNSGGIENFAPYIQ